LQWLSLEPQLSAENEDQRFERCAWSFQLYETRVSSSGDFGDCVDFLI